MYLYKGLYIYNLFQESRTEMWSVNTHLITWTDHVGLQSACLFLLTSCRCVSHTDGETVPCMCFQPWSGFTPINNLIHWAAPFPKVIVPPHSHLTCSGLEINSDQILMRSDNERVCTRATVCACVFWTSSCVQPDNQTHSFVCFSQNEQVCGSVKGHFRCSG